MGVLVHLEASNNGLLSVDTGKHGLSPFLKWAGGKTSIIPHLLPKVPDHFSDYYEPFLGGGAFFFAICGKTTEFTAHLSDINEELTNAYLVVKEKPSELIEELTHLQSEYYSSKDKEAYFYEKRAWQPTRKLESAARLIFLNKTCYNGLYRVNAKGRFNVPFGDYKKPTILDSEKLQSISWALRKTDAQIRQEDYKSAVSNCKGGDFVYFDPPYNPTSRTSSFTDYSPLGFSEHDQKSLADLFSRLTRRGCQVLESNSDTPLVRKLYQGFVMHELRVPRPINSVAERRKNFKEVLISARHPRRPIASRKRE